MALSWNTSHRVCYVYFHGPQSLPPRMQIIHPYNYPQRVLETEIEFTYFFSFNSISTWGTKQKTYQSQCFFKDLPVWVHLGLWKMKNNSIKQWQRSLTGQAYLGRVNLQESLKSKLVGKISPLKVMNLLWFADLYSHWFPHIFGGEIYNQITESYILLLENYKV